MLLFPDQWRYEWHSLEVPGRVPGAKADVRTPTLAAHAARDGRQPLDGEEHGIRAIT